MNCKLVRHMGPASALSTHVQPLKNPPIIGVVTVVVVVVVAVATKRVHIMWATCGMWYAVCVRVKNRLLRNEVGIYMDSS